MKKTKHSIVLSPTIQKGKEKRELKEKMSSSQKKWCFSERRLDFSLSFRQIRPSTIVGTRREAALRGEGFAWVPDLRSFLKLREVGVSPYLGFILYLSTLLMFELNEVVRGRLIGPKSWNLNVRNFFYPLCGLWQCTAVWVRKLGEL